MCQVLHSLLHAPDLRGNCLSLRFERNSLNNGKFFNWVQRIRRRHSQILARRMTHKMVRAASLGIKGRHAHSNNSHTYLDGISSFNYLGLWAVEILHSMATLSSGGVCSLYVLRRMHRLNISPSRIGHSGWAGSSFLCFCWVLTLTLNVPAEYQ